MQSMAVFQIIHLLFLLKTNTMSYCLQTKVEKGNVENDLTRYLQPQHKLGLFNTLSVFILSSVTLGVASTAALLRYLI